MCGRSWGAVGAAVTPFQLPAVDVLDQVFVDGAAGLGQLAVQVKHVRAGALVEVVHVLRDDADVEIALKLRECEMAGGAGLGLPHLAAALVVETQHQLRIARPAFRGGDVLDAVVFQRPSAPRKVRRPLSALMPAPVRTTSFRLGEEVLLMGAAWRMRLRRAPRKAPHGREARAARKEACVIRGCSPLRRVR